MAGTSPGAAGGAGERGSDGRQAGEFNLDEALVDSFRFNREWMREQFERVNNPCSSSYAVTTRINLPPAYLLIHRTWLGGIGLLSQLEAEAPFRSILEESLPGFAE